VPFVVDQHPVGAFGACGAYPPLHLAVRAAPAAESLVPGRPRICLRCTCAKDAQAGGGFDFCGGWAAARAGLPGAARGWGGANAT
jgi:hypothetical protein